MFLAFYRIYVTKKTQDETAAVTGYTSEYENLNFGIPMAVFTFIAVGWIQFDIGDERSELRCVAAQSGLHLHIGKQNTHCKNLY